MFTHSLFASKLVRWYQAHKRALPWRTTRDPYRIWLSEIVLQQTRVVQGLPYYQRFVVKYPSVQALACADQEEVLRLWQGLGYYARARNMHACARMIVHELEGVFPSTYADLLRLPGVGPYTAAAIASIAFGEVVPVVDGNVYRVLARVFGVEADITTVQGNRTFHALAQSLVPQEDVGLYNQALMEFGALHCTPVRPQCASCIFKSHCVAFRTEKQTLLPVKSKRVKIKSRYLHYLVFQDASRLYMKRRGVRGIWGNLYDFYLIENDQLCTLDQLQHPLVALATQHALPIVEPAVPYKHLLTHQRLYAYFFQIHVTARFIAEAMPLLRQAGVGSFTVAQTKTLPKPILIDKFLKAKIYN